MEDEIHLIQNIVEFGPSFDDGQTIDATEWRDIKNKAGVSIL
jgi:hypothetical protein